MRASGRSTAIGRRPSPRRRSELAGRAGDTDARPSLSEGAMARHAGNAPAVSGPRSCCEAIRAGCASNRAFRLDQAVEGWRNYGHARCSMVRRHEDLVSRKRSGNVTASRQGRCPGDRPRPLLPGDRPLPLLPGRQGLRSGRMLPASRIHAASPGGAGGSGFRGASPRVLPGGGDSSSGTGAAPRPHSGPPGGPRPRGRAASGADGRAAASARPRLVAHRPQFLPPHADPPHLIASPGT